MQEATFQEMTQHIFTRSLVRLLLSTLSSSAVGRESAHQR